MMKDNEEIVAIPYNDHAIFVDEYGILSEREPVCLPDNSPTLSRVPNLLPTVRR